MPWTRSFSRARRTCCSLTKEDRELLLHPLRVVVAAPGAEEIAGLIRDSGRDVEIRCRPTLSAATDDLLWANTLVAGQPVADADLGEIRWIHSTNAGVDSLLFERGWPRDILLTRTLGDFPARIGEFCLCRALLLSQRILELRKQQSSKQWERLDIEPLSRSRVVVVGTGEIGTGIARAFSGLGCRVTGVSKSGVCREPFSEVLPVERIGEALRQADCVLLALPLTKDTENLLDRTLLRQCRGAALTNVGRGRVLVEADLLEALDEGWISHASLDVFQTEPLPQESALWERDDVLISPHIAAKTLPSEVAEDFLEALTRLEQGVTPRLAVNPVRGY